MLKTWAVLCAAGLLFAAQQGHAQQCGFARCWGAVGVGPDGARGFAHGQYSEELAQKQAQALCKDGCDTVQTFYNGCGAMAQGTRGQWGFGESHSRTEAEGVALAYCQTFGAGCEVRAWACSP